MKEKVLSLLREKGYQCVELGGKSSVDIIAKKDRTLVIVVLTNMDGLKSSHARDAVKLAKILRATVLGIAEKSKRGYLQNDVVYYRYGIPFITLSTFEDFLEGKYPQAVYIKGKDVVNIDSHTLRKVRREKGISLEELARKVGVTKETIYRYEHGYPPTLPIARKLEKVLETKLIEPFYPSYREFPDSLTHPFILMKSLGSEVREFERLPWDALARGSVSISFIKMENLSKQRVNLLRKGKGSIYTYFLVIGKYKGLPYIEEEEVENAETFSEIEDIARERNE